MTTEEAIEIVARHVIAELATDAYDKWELWPEIGGRDWEGVLLRVDDLAPSPEPAEYGAAYKVLTDRADHTV